MKVRSKIIRFLRKKYIDGSPTELYNYIGSSGDHNTREITKHEFKKLLDDLKNK